MSPSLREYISKLPVFTYDLSNKHIVIGRLLEEQPTAVKINSICSIQLVQTSNKSIQQILIPLIPYNIEEISTIEKDRIIISTPASFELKKLYCDTILKSKVNSLILSSLETFNYMREADHKNDRWNINFSDN